MRIKITKTWRGNGGKKEIILRDKAIELLEDRGYYTHGTINEIETQLLKDGKPVTLQTPFAYYEFSRIGK
jgi:hypothetical protein